MFKPLFLLVLAVVAFVDCVAQTKNTFKTSQGLTISVRTNGIYVNGNNLFTIDPEDELYFTDRQCRLIETSGSTFLFVPADGRPREEKLHCFKITADKVALVLKAINSEIRNRDDDPYPEFGGEDITESYTTQDSMYYVPTRYYEIRDGKILFDSVLTINMDISRNGLYMSAPMTENGYCCKVVATPVPLVDPLIISERIDGPANIRDEVNGNLLFTLADNVPVTRGNEKNNWYAIGLTVDLTPAQFTKHLIEKGSPLYVKGKTVGKALNDIHLDEQQYRENKTVQIGGYTAMQNIKPNTLPENILSAIISENTAGLSALRDFIKGFGLRQCTNGDYTAYCLEGLYTVYDISAPVRIGLYFEKSTLAGILHLNKIDYKHATAYKLTRNYYLTVPGKQSAEKINKLITQLNDMLNHAD
ncbi:hypothetical protein [Chitinophaga agri]|uniref:Uncharacterized protein n=1 Tax=Chitinophaga agri TaxID=2703787 RepID=A0A6B9ZMB9_9BACT|nr:hypothetical protein [Chitinophaga agri]QHS63600.1 hypothetical protein GWR21_29675 [Chitinophaga agri]